METEMAGMTYDGEDGMEAALEAEMAGMSYDDKYIAEADALRAKVRALEAEMAGMSHDDDDDVDDDDKGVATTAAAAAAPVPATELEKAAEDHIPVASTRMFTRQGSFALRKFDFAAAKAAHKAAAKAKGTPVRAFKRNGAFTLRKLNFGSAAAPSVSAEGDFTLYTFGDAAGETAGDVAGEATTPSRGFTRTPGSFKLRKLKFGTGARAAASRGAVEDAVMVLSSAEAVVSVTTAAVAGPGAFARVWGNFIMRRFDFIKARATGRASNTALPASSRRAGFKRSGGFTMRRFNFL